MDDYNLKAINQCERNDMLPSLLHIPNPGSLNDVLGLVGSYKCGRYHLPGYESLFSPIYHLPSVSVLVLDSAFAIPPTNFKEMLHNIAHSVLSI